MFNLSPMCMLRNKYLKGMPVQAVFSVDMASSQLLASTRSTAPAFVFNSTTDCGRRAY